MVARKAQVERNTLETQIKVSINLDGTGQAKFDTGVPFLEHMLDQICRHGLIDIDAVAKGDLHIDAHHTVEDCGIVLGKALKEDIFPIEAVERYGNATVVMDEAATTCALDLSNRPYLVYEVNVSGKVGDFDVELAESIGMENLDDVLTIIEHL